MWSSKWEIARLTNACNVKSVQSKEQTNTEHCTALNCCNTVIQWTKQRTTLLWNITENKKKKKERKTNLLAKISQSELANSATVSTVSTVSTVCILLFEKASTFCVLGFVLVNVVGHDAFFKINTHT